MADATAGISETISNVGSGALNIGIMLIVMLISVGVIIGIYFVLKNAKKYKQFRVVIFDEDTFGQTKQTKDDAGIFVDKITKNKRLFLKKANVGLNADDIPYVIDEKGNKTIYLRKEGLKNYKKVKIILSANKEVKMLVGEEDVNWAVNSYERAKKAFTQTMLMQYLPFIVLAFVSIVILIMFLYFFQQFSVLKELGVALRDAAQALGSGTTIIQS